VHLLAEAQLHLVAVAGITGQRRASRGLTDRGPRPGRLDRSDTRMRP
jgi:hypothetical protein